MRFYHLDNVASLSLFKKKNLFIVRHLEVTVQARDTTLNYNASCTFNQNIDI